MTGCMEKDPRWHLINCKILIANCFMLPSINKGEFDKVNWWQLHPLKVVFHITLVINRALILKPLENNPILAKMFPLTPTEHCWSHLTVEDILQYIFDTWHPSLSRGGQEVCSTSILKNLQCQQICILCQTEVTFYSYLVSTALLLWSAY